MINSKPALVSGDVLDGFEKIAYGARLFNLSRRMQSNSSFASKAVDASFTGKWNLPGAPSRQRFWKAGTQKVSNANASF